MQLVREPEAYRRACDAARAAGHRVAIVPTMGALHAGHMALVEAARARADWVALSVFVNPTQFGPNEDFERYPRTLEADVARCEAAGVALVYAPPREAMYPAGEETRVRVGATAAPLCGRFRPVHFEGVTTVVAKLFALTGPCLAAFGRKDYQQLRVITRMTTDLFLPVEILGVPIVREPDGLALSSRNAYLSADDRARGLSIARALSAAVRRFDAGERDPEAIVRPALAAVRAAASSVDYVELVDADTLAPPPARLGARVLLAVAARFGATRLIDNVVLGEDGPPLAAGA
ncbi:MAG: pantoate--beta-alanine ligase [Myxococcales bacterium]|nr:pantoate--beta-alanine ligase [Myxococcales bacterium]